MNNYQICIKCVMDTTDKNITFNEKGVCSHCRSYESLIETTWDVERHVMNNDLEKLFEHIKKSKGNSKYDCIIGLSGGVDSSYIAFLAKKYKLTPLCVHLDNGWNSELATNNIHNIIDICNFDLHTHVINWSEFRELQKAFFKANVIDLELLSDHAISGVIMKLAKKYNIKHILSGANYSTEYIMPKSWVHRKLDLTNIKSINMAFGTQKLKTFPMVSTLKHVINMYLLGYKVHKPLNLFNYNKSEAKTTLIKEFEWKDYGGKHYESIFTKFYQAHILPKKFNVDKRRAHLSSLIVSGQMTREEAIKELSLPLYDEAELLQDEEFVLKKLNFTKNWFDTYLKESEIPHLSYKSDQKIYNLLENVQQFFKIKKQ